jgi:uncharacterized membrane protein
MKNVVALLFFLVFCKYVEAQKDFTIKHYHINLKINKNASLDITENLDVHFLQSRHEIIRSIPCQYSLEKLPAGIEKAERQMHANGYTRIFIENVKVPGHKFSTSKSGEFENIKIGSTDKYVEGDQHYVIKYTILNAINFFKNHSELYFNLIGTQWATTIDSVDFKVELPQALSDTPYYFVATGILGSKENNTVSSWQWNKILYGHTTQKLNPYEGFTIGISFPKGFLIKPNYTLRGIWWLFLPIFVFIGMYLIWKKWGKDEKVTVQAEYYPPENVSPGVSGYIIDDKLNQRDLTALVPYWGAGGYLRVNEIEKNSLLGVIKTKDYEFIKLKDLPEFVPQFEKTLFGGIFATSDKVKLSDLKNVLFATMNKAKSQLEIEINKEDYYVMFSKSMGCIFPFLGILAAAIGFFALVDDWQEKLWLGISLIVSGIILVSFGVFMNKKTKKGTLLYQKLLGFKEFIKTVEKERLEEFLKQDENYFDKVLPYAIVFDMADKWKDKLKGLDMPPPKWYSGYYTGNNFNTLMFMNSLDHSMNEMTHTFYSVPSSIGKSGGRFSGGGSSW